MGSDATGIERGPTSSRVLGVCRPVTGAIHTQTHTPTPTHTNTPTHPQTHTHSLSPGSTAPSHGPVLVFVPNFVPNPKPNPNPECCMTLRRPQSALDTLPMPVRGQPPLHSSNTHAHTHTHTHIGNRKQNPQQSSEAVRQEKAAGAAEQPQTSFVLHEEARAGAAGSPQSCLVAPTTTTIPQTQNTQHTTHTHTQRERDMTATHSHAFALLHTSPTRMVPTP